MKRLLRLIPSVLIVLLAYLLYTGKRPMLESTCLFLAPLALAIGLELRRMIRDRDWACLRRGWGVIVPIALLGTLCSLSGVWQGKPTLLFDAALWLRLALTFVVTLVGGKLLYDFLWERARRQPSLTENDAPWAVFAVTFVLCLCALLLVWSVKYPYGTSYDVKIQWNQTHGVMHYNNVHAIGHTIFLKVLQVLWDDLRLPVLVQMVALAAMYASFAVMLSRKGASIGWMAALLAVFVGCSIQTLSYAYPWKDIPYAICLGVVTLYLMRLSDDDAPLSWPQALLLGCAIAFSALFRLNGIIAAVACGVYLIVIFLKRRQKKPLLFMLAGIAACVLAVEGCSAFALHTRQLKNGFSMGTYASGIGAVLVNDDDLTEEQTAQLDAIFSPELITYIRENHIPWKQHQMISNQEFLWDDPPAEFDDVDMQVFNNRYVLALGEHPAEILRLYLSLLPTHLGTMLTDLLQNTFVVWGIHYDNFQFTNMFLLLLLLLATGACWNARTWKKHWVIFLPIVCSVLSIFVSTITNEYRYILPTFTLFPVLLLYIVRSEAPAARR